MTTHVTSQLELTQTREEVKKGIENGTLQVWSCNPKDIPVYSEEDIVALKAAFAKMFGWENKDETKGQNGCIDERTVPNPRGNGDSIES